MNLGEVPNVQRLIELARAEDLGTGDVTTRLAHGVDQCATFRLLVKQPGVFCGKEVAASILAAFDTSLRLQWTASAHDGQNIAAVPTELATVTGPLGALLSAERTLLNFLQRLCGVASLTRRFVDAVADTRAEIFDTRKTIPGWRVLDKYAVRCGGGHNHRMGLYDAVLIKDNHLSHVPPPRLAAAVFNMLNGLESLHARLDSINGDCETSLQFVAVEARSIAEVLQLFSVIGIDVILLDNFSPEMIREAVALRESHGLAAKVAFEVSGGVRLENVRGIAELGVERISVGALTHSAPALDLCLERC